MTAICIGIVWLACCGRGLPAKTVTLPATTRAEDRPTSDTVVGSLNEESGYAPVFFHSDLILLGRWPQGNGEYTTSRAFARFDLSEVDQPILHAEIRIPADEVDVYGTRDGFYEPLVIFIHDVPSIEESPLPGLYEGFVGATFLDFDLTSASIYGEREFSPDTGPADWTFRQFDGLAGIQDGRGAWGLPTVPRPFFAVPLNSTAIDALNARVGRGWFAAGISLNQPPYEASVAQSRAYQPYAELQAGFGERTIYLDLIVVPEPSSWILLGLTAPLLWWRARSH